MTQERSATVLSIPPSKSVAASSRMSRAVINSRESPGLVFCQQAAHKRVTSLLYEVDHEMIDPQGKAVFCLISGKVKGQSTAGPDTIDTPRHLESGDLHVHVDRVPEERPARTVSGASQRNSPCPRDRCTKAHPEPPEVKPLWPWPGRNSPSDQLPPGPCRSEDYPGHTGQAASSEKGSSP